jgi:hypothetical protein
MAEEHVLVRRKIVLPVIEAVGRRHPRVVQGEHFGGDEGAVIPIGDRVDTKHAD